MKRSWISLSMFALVCFMGLFISGCNDKGGNAVAVVDLDAVAKALGKDQVIHNQLQELTNRINAKLGEDAQNYTKQIKDASEKAGPTPNDTAKQQLNTMRNNAQAILADSKQKYANLLRNQQVKLAEDFRNEVKPIAERFARQRGASVVMVSTGLILWMDGQVDITADVIGAMRAAPTPAAAATPAPAPAPGNAATPAPAQAPKN